MLKAKFFRKKFLIGSRLIRGTDASAWFGYYVLLASAVGLNAAPSHAAPIVVREISYDHGGTQASSLPTSLPFDFRIYEPTVEPTHVYTSWLQNYAPADVGMSFFAPAEVVAGATVARSSTTALVVLEVNRGTFHSTPEPWWLGIPSDHYITDIERIVDSLVITPIDETLYTVQFAQRLRIWAEPIPEPSTTRLLAIALSYGFMGRRIACGRHRPRFRSPHCPK
jgi:hypothetical protein